MASTATAGDSHSIPSSPATSPTAFLDDHPGFLLSPSYSQTFLDDQAVPPSFFYLPGVGGGAGEQGHPPLPQQAAADQRRPPRKRPRASRRPPTTVLTTDASNFRAMVQEFTGFPAPLPLSGLPPHLLSGGALFPSGSTSPAFQPIGASPTTNTTSLVLGALTLLAKTRAIAAAAAAAAAAPPTSGSELYGSDNPLLSRAVPFDDGFLTADGEIAEAAAGHRLSSSTPSYAGERRY